MSRSLGVTLLVVGFALTTAQGCDPDEPRTEEPASEGASLPSVSIGGGGPVDGPVDDAGVTEGEGEPVDGPVDDAGMTDGEGVGEPVDGPVDDAGVTDGEGEGEPVDGPVDDAGVTEGEGEPVDGPGEDAGVTDGEGGPVDGPGEDAGMTDGEGEDFTLFTNQEVYAPGDVVVVFGRAPPNEVIAVRIFRGTGQLVSIGQTSANDDGEWEKTVMSFPAELNTMFSAGTYTVDATATPLGQQRVKGITLED